EETGADALLTGEVLGISIVPVNLNEQQLASRYLFTVAMKVAFTDTHTQDVIWSNDSLVFRGEYDLQPTAGAFSGETFLDTQRSSMDRIATDVARSVVTAILEAF
ncbi:MAG TPA: LPS assembly lipoprotein LptE, partial [Vicinamibacterales bacterium]|nr:LPS assembly lipoprotein LptE [Vicinamibacterales bacterium]